MHQWYIAELVELYQEQRAGGTGEDSVVVVTNLPNPITYLKSLAKLLVHKCIQNWIYARVGGGQKLSKRCGGVQEVTH